MDRESLAHGSSILHTMDPSLRVVVCLVLSFSTALCQGFPVLAVFAALALLLLVMSRPDPVVVISRIKPLIFFLSMIWLILPITYGGGAELTLGSLSLSRPGIFLCLGITIKSLTILFLFMALLATMTVPTLGVSLHRLGLPDKLIFLLLMTYRYIAVIEDEYKRLLRAARLRGFKGGTHLHAYRTYAYLAGMLFVRAALRADRVHQAMRCRGFDGRFRTLEIYDKPHGKSSFLMTCIASLAVVLVSLDLFWM